MMTKRLGSGLLALFLVSSVAAPLDELYAAGGKKFSVKKGWKGFKRRVSGRRNVRDLQSEAESSQSYYSKKKAKQLARAEKYRRKAQAADTSAKEAEAAASKFEKYKN